MTEPEVFTASRAADTAGMEPSVKGGSASGSASAWREAFAFVAVSLLGGAVLAGLVYLAEIVSRFLPVQPWSWVPVTA